MNNIALRKIELRDIPNILAVEQKVWNQNAVTKKQLTDRINTFQEGNLVVISNNTEIIGYCSVLRTDMISTTSWRIQTNNGTIKGVHQPDGRILFGVSASAVSTKNQPNIAKIMVSHIERLFIHTGKCNQIYLGSRIPKYSKWNKINFASVEEYLNIDQFGYSIDPEVRLWQQLGFKVLEPVRDYFPDISSENYGVIMVKRF